MCENGQMFQKCLRYVSKMFQNVSKLSQNFQVCLKSRLDLKGLKGLKELEN